ncbi:MAG: hypothetical protein K6G52_04605 [Treponemataceae bacterium]|nr:hypothetical protein [Treponemataceae bacterium]
MKKEYKLVAPDIDRLLNCFGRGHLNPSGITEKLDAAMKPLFEALLPLAPLKSNNEAKVIWLQIPRGDISDFDSFEDLKEYGEVKTYKEYEKLWKEEYPDEIKWYRLAIVEGKDLDGKVDFKAVALGNKTIISARMNENSKADYEVECKNDFAVALCELIVSAAKKSVELLKIGEYNKMVEVSLPYWFRTGVIKRTALWNHEPEIKKHDFDGLSEKTISRFRELLASGVNDENKIGRKKVFTANDFFRACVVGYKACGYAVEEKTPSELYLQYADGRDEGLTGTGCGLNAGPGIDFDDSAAWDSWYFGNRGGGHPWEVVPGGNSTHVELYVRHDENKIGYLFRSGRLTESEYKERQKNEGFYFGIAGKYRTFEVVSFYVALSDAGIPVFLNDAEEILARFDGSDYVGIVPHDTFPRYCESMFPDEYGKIIDFMHVYDEDIEKYGNDIIWLPQTEAELLEK